MKARHKQTGKAGEVITILDGIVLVDMDDGTMIHDSEDNWTIVRAV